MAVRRGLIGRGSALGFALALIVGAGGVVPLGVGSVAVATDPAALSGVQDVPNVGRTPETATLVAPGATIRSIFDPNRGPDRWFAIDLAGGDSLAVAVDAATPGTVALTGSPAGATPVFIRVPVDPPGTTVETDGRYLIRFQGPSASGASRYALTFVVTPSPTPRATLPPAGMLVCGAVDLSGRVASSAPGTPVCPGAIVTSELSGAHPEDVFAIDLAWGEELGVTTEGTGVLLTFAYPSDVASASGAVWYPLPALQVASEEGTFLVRASLADGATSAPYTATFDVVPLGVDSDALVQDIELAPGCEMRSAGVPLAELSAQDGRTILFRVTDTAPERQDLVIGPADALAAGRLEGLDTVVTQPDAVTSSTLELATGGVPWAIGCLDAELVIRSTVPISSAPALVAVPDLMGLTLGKAAGALIDAGLAGGSPQTVHDAAPAGTVIRTDPSAGTLVAPGTVVTLILSDGQPTDTPFPVRTMPPPPTLEPTPAPTPVPTPEPTPALLVTPPPVSSTASPRAPEPTAFTCDGRTVIADPLQRGWKVTQVFWAKRDGYDRVTVRLQPDPRRDGGRSRVILETLSPEGLAATLPGVEVNGDTAVTLRFAGPIGVTGEMSGSPGMGGMQSVLITPDGIKRPWAVVGVTGDGCAALTVPAWTDPSTQTTPFVDVTLDIER